MKEELRRKILKKKGLIEKQLWILIANGLNNLEGQAQADYFFELINTKKKVTIKEIFTDINSGYFEKLLKSKGWNAERDYKCLLEHLIKIQHKYWPECEDE